MSRSRRPQRPPARPRWRRTVDAFGGFVTIGAMAALVLVVGALVLRGPLAGGSSAPSSAPLRGEAVAVSDGSHTTDPALVRPRGPGEPPVGGPHFAVPQAAGVYDAPVVDGNAVHSLEHGLVWISYNPQLLDAVAVTRLKRIAEDYAKDTVLSPRAENASAVAVASWGRLLQLGSVDERQVREFITTNRNRSPEAGVR